MTEITIAVNQEFADELFNTCKDLQAPLIGKVVNMFCGKYSGVGMIFILGDGKLSGFSQRV